MSKKKKTDSAVVNNGFLVITLTQSKTPVVWRLELEKANIAAFEIKEAKNTHALTIKLPRKAIEVIGEFDQKDQALEALLIVSDALQGQDNTQEEKQVQEKIVETPKVEIKQTTKSNKALVASLSTLFVVILFYYYWAHVMPSTQVFDTQVINATTSSDAASQTGVPVSADDMLKGF
ncbi:MAG: hypothetical protein AAF988_08100 [Pseudomonadota bacterium]